MTLAASTPPCTGCGRPLAPGDGSCAACGTPGGRAERRLVTLLFADLAGYTSLCEAHDPEDVHRLVRPLMNRLRQVCESRGGLVPSIEGDGFLAVFGARAAQEDDPAGALAAALEMQQGFATHSGLPAEVSGLHVAVHAGEVLVAPTWEASGVSLSGDAVNVCRRLCSLAAPGEVLASRSVVELTPAIAAWGPVRSMHLRGRTEPVEVCELLRHNTAELVTARTWGSGTSYLPRPDLEKALRSALSRGRSVVLRGEAGSGKSRLLREVLTSLPHVLTSCTSLRARRTLDVAAALLGQADSAPAGLVALLRGEAGTGEPVDEHALLEAAARALKDLPEAPVLVLEDAERLDAAGELALLAELVLLSGRTWVFVSRRGLALPVDVVEVPPFSPAEARVFLGALLPNASDDLLREVLARGGTVPLFLEQCARFLLESGAAVVEAHETRLVEPDLLRSIPTSLELFVASRLDLLPGPERLAVDVAAVLGDVPDPDLLRHLSGVAEDAVESLVARNLLRWTDGPFRTPELRFCHGLVRDVAYQRILRARRVEIHRAAAEWYASLPAAQVLEAQAFHLEAAATLGEADCELVGRAVEALVLFARSVEEERTRAAVDAVDRATVLVENHPSCPIDTLQLHLARSVTACLTGDVTSAEHAAVRAAEQAQARGETKAEAEAHLCCARAVWKTDHRRAEEELRAADEGYADIGDEAGRARVEVERAILREHDEGFGAFTASMERAYHMAQRAGDRRLQVSAAQQLAFHHAVITGRREFEQWAERAGELSREDDLGLRPRVDLGVATLAMMGRRPAEGLEAARRCLQTGRELGLSHVVMNAMLLRLELLVLQGDLSSVEGFLPLARQVASSVPTARVHRYVDLYEARASVRAADPARAHALLQEVASDARFADRGMARDVAEARAWVLTDQGDFRQARAQALESVLLAEEMSDRCGGLRPRLLAMVAAVALGEPLPLADIARLRADARETGLETISELAARWLYLEELGRGWAVDGHLLTDMPDLIEARALDLEIESLSTRRFQGLLAAADVWGDLGTTVWQARSLLWHSELTGTPHPEADELLRVLQSPPGLEEHFRSQVRALRT